MGEIEYWSVIGLKGLKTYRLLLIVQLTLKSTSLGLALKYQLSTESEDITWKSQTEALRSIYQVKSEIFQ